LFVLISCANSFLSAAFDPNEFIPIWVDGRKIMNRSVDFKGRSLRFWLARTRTRSTCSNGCSHVFVELGSACPDSEFRLLVSFVWTGWLIHAPVRFWNRRRVGVCCEFPSVFNCLTGQKWQRVFG
jgi:hypothetical protein